MIIRPHVTTHRGETGQAGGIISSFPCLSVIESVALQPGFVLF